MSRKKLVNNLLTKHSELGKENVERFVSIFFHSIASKLKADGRIELRNFGVFKIKNMPMRTIYNPYEKINDHVNASRVPSFKCSEKLHKIIK